jgi:hypothetical protein
MTAATAHSELPEATWHDNLPVAVADIADYLPMFYYGDDNLRARLVYPYSEPAALKFVGYTIAERMLLGSTSYFHTNVVPYRAFVQANRSFYLYGGVKVQTWLMPQLMADRAKLSVIPAPRPDDDRGFYDVFVRADMPESSR